VPPLRPPLPVWVSAIGPIWRWQREPGVVITVGGREKKPESPQKSDHGLIQFGLREAGKSRLVLLVRYGRERGRKSFCHKQSIFGNCMKCDKLTANKSSLFR